MSKKYIEADALTEKVIEVIERIGQDKEGTPKLQEFVATCLLGLIGVLPAADVRENVRGEWILISKETSRIKYYSCSKCGRHVEVNSELPAYLYFPFCHCGADMIGGEL